MYRSDDISMALFVVCLRLVTLANYYKFYTLLPTLCILIDLNNFKIIYLVNVFEDRTSLFPEALMFVLI